MLLIVVQILWSVEFRVLCTLRNLIQIVSDVEQADVLLPSPCSCHTPHPAKPDDSDGEGEKLCVSEGSQCIF